MQATVKCVNTAGGLAHLELRRAATGMAESKRGGKRGELCSISRSSQNSRQRDSQANSRCSSPVPCLSSFMAAGAACTCGPSCAGASASFSASSTSSRPSAGGLRRVAAPSAPAAIAASAGAGARAGGAAGARQGGWPQRCAAAFGVGGCLPPPFHRCPSSNAAAAAPVGDRAIVLVDRLLIPSNVPLLFLGLRDLGAAGGAAGALRLTVSSHAGCLLAR